MMPNLVGSPNCAAIKVSSGRNLFPPASTKCLEVSITSGYSPSMCERSNASTFCISANSDSSRFGSRFGTPKRGIYFMKLAKDVAEFRSKDGSKPSTTEIIIAAVIAILLLIVGISTETEALCGSVKNIMIITRI
ncbi:unannotated protein [freshwater metagenome]|uniref:Unannotated protein n=1 Tax=freshwater metagenome TaxID=449393 RepID=A0A6J6YMA4_9ZZZZ